MKKRVISILNHKGGVGKSTISTNLAGYFANQGKKVLIGDFDVQQSSYNWLEHRPNGLPKIYAWQINNGAISTEEKDIDIVIIDSPAGIRAGSLQKLVSMSDKVIVPLKPGYFDILSTESFLEEIVEIMTKMNYKEITLNTKAAEQLSKFISSTGLFSPTMIRQAQIYVHLAAHGLTIFDSKTNIFEREIAQWVPLINWAQDFSNFDD